MNERLVELWNAKVPVKEIASRLGCSEAVVNCYVSRHRDLCPRRRK